MHQNCWKIVITQHLCHVCDYSPASVKGFEVQSLYFNYLVPYSFSFGKRGCLGGRYGVLQILKLALENISVTFLLSGGISLCRKIGRQIWLESGNIQRRC